MKLTKLHVISITIIILVIITIPIVWFMWQIETKYGLTSDSDLINSISYEGFDWHIEHVQEIQGIIAEIENQRITFASGNWYYLYDTDMQELEAGHIITINENTYSPESCEIAVLKFDNRTKFVNDRLRADYKNSDPIFEGFRSNDELRDMENNYKWTEYRWYQYSQQHEYNPCKSYPRVTLNSIDGKLDMEKLN